MGLTTHQLPYPEQTDSVDVVRDVKALAEATDVKALTKTVAVFTPDAALWVADASNPSALTRIGGRWLLTVFVRNKNTGAINAGSAALGSVDATARVATGLPSVRTAGHYTLPTSTGTLGAIINTVTGAVSIQIPASLGTPSAGQLAIGFQLSWDAA